MTDNMSPARRAAMIRQAERTKRLNASHRPSGPDYSPEAFERHAEAVAPRGVAGPLGGYQYGPLRTGAQPAQDKEARKLAADAAAFQENPRMERLLQWEQKDDPRFDKLDPSERITLGLYRRQKAAAKEEGRG